MTLRNLIDEVERGDIEDGTLHAAFDVVHWASVEDAFKGSLDAAKSLHDALLPDYGYHLGGWGARVWLYSDRPHWDGSNRQEVEMPSAPARAWLLCILRALEQEGRDG